ncbi:MAG: TonB-dependent receptor, partial [Pseudomonadota bacterium]|nr:TonB-dependent receptor [Pseudomonadota bacterium]
AHALKTSSYVEQYQGQTQADIHRKNEIEFLSQELQHDWSISTSHLLTHGLAYELSELKQTRNNQSELQVNRPRRESVEGFMQWDAMLSPSVEVVSGVRIEHNSAYGVHISPKISAMFSQQLLEKNTNNAIDGRLRLSLGNGYRTPNLKESYFLFDHSNLGYMVVGNPNLEPESSWSAQASYQLFSREWEANAAIFYHDINDLIVTELSERQDGIAIYSYQNINQAQTYGVELSGQFQLNTQMSLNASYTSLQSKNIKTGKTLVNRPEHVIKAGIELGLFNQKTQLSVLGAYQSKEYLDSENSKTSPGFAVFDIKLNQQISSMLNFYAGLDNAFDEHRSPKRAALEGDQRPVPGRTYYAGLSATF